LLFHSHWFCTFSNSDFFHGGWIEFYSTKVNNLTSRTGQSSDRSCLFNALVVFYCVDIDLSPNFCIYFGWERPFSGLVFLNRTEQLLRLNFRSDRPLTWSERPPFLVLVSDRALGSCKLLVWLRICLKHLDIEHRLVNGADVSFISNDKIVELLLTACFPCEYLILELFLGFDYLFQFKYFIFKLLNVLSFVLFRIDTWRLFSRL
jgi:hypothetical protein